MPTHITLLLFIFVTLSGCAGQQASLPKISVEEENLITENWANCVARSITALDDGISDARTIARATVGACPDEFKKFFDSFTQNDNSAVKRSLWLKRHELQSDFALPLVLKVRQSKR